MELSDLLAGAIDGEVLHERLREVIDPELGVNIVDLGLVYGAKVVNGVAEVLMTTTTPACPIGSYLSDEIRWALLDVASVLDVRVEVTHDPPWTPDRMSEAAKARLGWSR